MKRWLALPASAWRAMTRQPLLAFLNLVALPASGLAAWGWLYLPDSSVAWVIASFLLAFTVVVVLLLLVHFTFLSYYRAHYPMRILASVNIHPKEKSLLRRSLGALPLLTAWFVVFGLLCAALSLVNRQTIEWAKPIASWITMFTQRPVSFYHVDLWLGTVVDALQWVLLPMVFLAAFAGMAGAAAWGGRKRKWLHHALRLMKTPGYWVLWLVFLAVGVWLPGTVVDWVPVLDGVFPATLSLMLRFVLAVVLLWIGWLLFLSTLARLLKYPKQTVIQVRRPPENPA